VRETVEATVREVLSNPDLIRSAIAQHAPMATPTPQQPRKTLKEALKEKLAALFHKAAEKASQAKRGLGSAWSWCLDKLSKGSAWLWGGCKAAVAGIKWLGALAWLGLGCAWKFKKTTAAALAVGSVVGVGAYFSGPEIAGALCGLGGAMMTAAGSILWPLCR